MFGVIFHLPVLVYLLQYSLKQLKFFQFPDILSSGRIVFLYCHSKPEH